ncbi:ArdC family protein [Phocoenobacter skyensis]|uniref:ArdC family protein n=1 Tax=Phocoenobacter skyensis TaxID=97481 RepID=UPI00277474D9|nr:zincin-like metallopeptidase domain-containing protein [Pasteurella skyensis]MDP8185349.1 zincin-like metallopeptidase domain-containing protein [Pasteurella skyensis]
MKKSINQQKDLYQQITDKIVNALEKGTMPWIKPWNQAVSGLPYNADSKRSYQGINCFLLWLSQLQNGYSQRKWVTFNGATNLGGRVKKGEKSTLIMFYRPKEVEETDKEGNTLFDEDGQPIMKQTVIIGGHHVFNIEQCEGLEAHFETSIKDDEELIPEHEFIDRLELDLLPNNIGVKLHNAQQDRACYIPSLDAILMPEKSQFKSNDSYYATLLHECGHSTGHRDRFKREGIIKGTQGSIAYAFEELIAELISAFVCANVEIDNTSQNAAYIKSWISVLKSDKKAIFRASSEARKATDYLMKHINVDSDVLKEAC